MSLAGPSLTLPALIGVSGPQGFRSPLAGLKDRRPHQKSNGPSDCVGQESNLHSTVRVGYSHLGSPMPSRHLLTKKTPPLANGSPICEVSRRKLGGRQCPTAC